MDLCRKAFCMTHQGKRNKIIKVETWMKDTSVMVSSIARVEFEKLQDLKIWPVRTLYKYVTTWWQRSIWLFHFLQTTAAQHVVQKLFTVNALRLEKWSIFNKQVERDVKTGLMPGPLNLQHLLGPRRCRYFQPVEDTMFKKGIFTSVVLINYFILQFSPTCFLPVLLNRVLTICHTCMMLSSDTEQMTHGSLGFQEKSEIFAVCPPWMN